MTRSTPTDPRRLSAAFHGLVGGLSADDQKALDAALVAVDVPAGGVVLAEGRPADSLSFVVAGSLLASVDAGGRVDLGTKKPGDWVGDTSLVSPGPATCTVTATEPSRILTLSPAAFRGLIQDHPAVAGTLLSGICCDLARRLRRSGQIRVEVKEGRVEAVPLLRALHGVERSQILCEWVPSGSAKHRVRSADPAALLATFEKVGAFRTSPSDDPELVAGLRRDIESLARVTEIETFLDGETVIAGGTRPDGLYVVLGGRLRVRTPEEGADVHLDRVMGPGELVGLVAFFDDGTRTASCTAEGATVLAVIYAASVQEIVRQGARGAPLGVHLLHWFARQLSSDTHHLDTRISSLRPSIRSEK